MKFADETFARQVLNNEFAAEELRKGYKEACADVMGPGGWRYTRPITIPIILGSINEVAGARFEEGDSEPVIIQSKSAFERDPAETATVVPVVEPVACASSRDIDAEAARLSALRSAAFPKPARLNRLLALSIDSPLIVGFIQTHLEREMAGAVPKQMAEARAQYQAAYSVAPQDVRLAFFKQNCTVYR